MLDIGANRAIDLIVAKESGAGSRFGRAAADAGRPLGDHPDGGPVTQGAGRYGPYVKYGKIYANIPKDTDPAGITLERALELIAAKAGAGGKKAAPKKSAAKTSPAKKSPAKKSAAAKAKRSG